MCTDNKMSNIRHFIWDFDGTLFDTYPTIIQALRCALQDFGYDCDPVDAMTQMLDTIGYAQNYYAEKYNIPRDALVDAYMRHRSILVPQYSSLPFPGVSETLERICQTGRYNYIFTHRDSSETAFFLKKHNLEEYFQEIICPDSPHFAMKPAPDAILYLMQKYDMTGENAVMVGDRDCDLESAHRAGIRTVHKVCPVAFQELPCNWRFDAFDEMRKLLG